MKVNYWERRQQELNSALEKDEEKLKKRLSSYFDIECRKLEKQIAAYYKQYGTDNVIQYRQLMESLSDVDRRLLIEQMDEFAQLYPEYANLLPVRETIYKLNRLEGLQMSVLMQQYEIGVVDNEEIRKHLEKQALRNANAAAETMGYGKNFYTEDSNIIKTVVDTKWCNGKDFSERIWGNVEKLAQYLSSDIAAGFARGDRYEKLVRQLRQRFGKVSRNDAYRLIYTEGTYVMNEARAAAFEQDTEEYIFRIQYDKIRRSGWRDICDDLNEKVFRWDERKPGINFPPMHAWCHCSATPYVSDRQKFIEDYEKRHGNSQAEKVANQLQTDSVGGIIKEKNIHFTESRTLKEAEVFVKEICGISNCSYKGISLEVANEMNKSLVNALNYCPSLKGRVNFYGSAQERNKLFKKELEEYWFNYLNEKYSDILSEKELRKQAKSFASGAVSKVPRNCLAFASSGRVDGADEEYQKIFKKYAGICVNNQWGSDYELFKSVTERDVKNQFHPVGTDTIEAVFDHEFGHQLDYLYHLRSNTTIKELYDSMSKDEIKQELSKYGSTDIAEFIAEGYTEYLNSDNPRHVSTVIGEIIEKEVNGK